MRSGTRQLVSAGIGIVAAGAVSLLLVAGEYEAFSTQSLAAFGYPAGPAPAVAFTPPVSVPAALLIGVTAAVVAVLCGWRRLSPVAPLAAGLPLFAFGLLTLFDTWRVANLFGGSLTLPWSRLVTDQVFLVLGGVLIIAAAMPSRWWPGRAVRRRSPNWAGPAVVLGLVAIPLAWYLVQLTNLSAANYLDTYWWFPVQPNPDYFVYVLFVLVTAALGVLAASRTFRITAVLVGAPMLIVGLLVFLAPPVAKDVIDGVMFSPAWRYDVLLDAASGLPLLYGGILVTAGLMPRARPRKATAAAQARAAGGAGAGPIKRVTGALPWPWRWPQRTPSR